MKNAAERPLASIIIVAWRLVEELQDCLDSIEASVDAPPYEVIVVLNGTSAETEAVARAHAVVDVVIHRDANIGFGNAGNLASTVARGDHLVFLNDDTRVDRSWLAALVAAIDKTEDRVAIASLLVNYDGTVQEAGSRILSHGGTVQMAKSLTMEEAKASGFLDEREIDYGSGAALLIRKSAFERAHGFDPAFEPAYFEDVDLQLRLRELGGHIWFEPGAIVLHHSGLSTKDDHWFRQFAANRSGLKFVERWAQILETAAAADDPVRQICIVPLADRTPPPGAFPTVEADQSLTHALSIAAAYQAWLINELDQYNDLRVSVPDDPSSASRRDLLDQARLLRARIDDLEERTAFGIFRMQVGVWVTRRREQFKARRQASAGRRE